MVMKNFTKNSLCDICGIKKKDFKNLRLFKQHYDQHTELSLPCKQCDKIPLGRRTDQTTEAVHQFLNRRMKRSNYIVKDIDSHAHGKKLYRAVLHNNSYKI